MLKNVLVEAAKYPSGFSNWLDLLQNHQFNYYEIVVAGNMASEKLQELNTKYIPNALVAATEKPSENYLLKGRFPENNTLIYVCVNNACKLPVQDIDTALQSIKISK